LTPLQSQSIQVQLALNSAQDFVVDEFLIPKLKNHLYPAIPSGSQSLLAQPQAVPPAPAGAADSRQDLEGQAIVEALQRTHGHKARAAAYLGLTRFQLYTRLKRYQIDVLPD
jgi:DNA-binding NtrC family response regulator